MVGAVETHGLTSQLQKKQCESTCLSPETARSLDRAVLQLSALSIMFHGSNLTFLCCGRGLNNSCVAEKGEHVIKHCAASKSLV